MKQISTLGGKRPNQHGRPKLPPEVRRVMITAMVKPETKKHLISKNENLGRSLDEIVVRDKS